MKRNCACEALKIKGVIKMEKTPKPMRLQIGIFGRTNVGKSSFLNMVTGQDVSITSPVPGTTTDVVEKTMEFHNLGPVVFLDTAGMNDDSELGKLRIKKAAGIVHCSDIILLVVEPDRWTEYERKVVDLAGKENIPVMAVVNKTDIMSPDEGLMRVLENEVKGYITCSSVNMQDRDRSVAALEKMLIRLDSGRAAGQRYMLSDLMPENGLAVLVVPIDLEAPKGRVKMLQVQCIRELLDNNKMAVTVKETEYAEAMAKLKGVPDLVVCDSPVAPMVAGQTPATVKCTTFSILMSRYKGDLGKQVKAVKAVDTLEQGDRVLIAEACSHHPIEEDIGRVKIPRAIRKRLGKDIIFDVCSGRDYPSVKDYKLIIHCGACMLTRKEMLSRISRAEERGVPVTNYGVCIAYLEGILDRMLSPFGVRYGSESGKTVKTARKIYEYAAY